MNLEKIKREFSNWFNKKIRHHIEKEKEIYFREKEVWWAAFGKNIGVEIDGKQELFERPVVILKKYNGDMCFVIPFTTQIKKPLPWFQILVNFGIEQSAAIISQGRTISSKRLLRKEAVLSDEDYDKIVFEFKEQFK